jgi:hypothetical protein
MLSELAIAESVLTRGFSAEHADAISSTQATTAVRIAQRKRKSAGWVTPLPAR